jgi:hypothetical protein
MTKADCVLANLLLISDVWHRPICAKQGEVVSTGWGSASPTHTHTHIYIYIYIYIRYIAGVAGKGDFS